jgi:flagellar biosynthesis/type III secretory pathway protein FliH
VSEKDIQKGYDLGYADGLAHGKLEGADEAEERILKLLEDKIPTIFSEGDWSRATPLQELRALIKGEQK